MLCTNRLALTLLLDLLFEGPFPGIRQTFGSLVHDVESALKTSFAVSWETDFKI